MCVLLIKLGRFEDCYEICVKKEIIIIVNLCSLGIRLALDIVLFWIFGTCRAVQNSLEF